VDLEIWDIIPPSLFLDDADADALSPEVGVETMGSESASLEDLEEANAAGMIEAWL
jgi:hypothetical protein